MWLCPWTYSDVPSFVCLNEESFQLCEVHTIPLWNNFGKISICFGALQAFPEDLHDMADSTSVSVTDSFKPPNTQLPKYVEVFEQTFHNKYCIKFTGEYTQFWENLQLLLDSAKTHEELSKTLKANFKRNILKTSTLHTEEENDKAIDFFFPSTMSRKMVKNSPSKPVRKLLHGPLTVWIYNKWPMHRVMKSVPRLTRKF